MQLYIGNKNYSSWSMRPWLLLKQFDIPFDEVMVRFDGFTPESQFKQRIKPISPTGRVPVLVHGEFVVWDTLAIAETLAELFPQLALWPRHAVARARARSVCAEMHSGFTSLRNHCPMNIEASFPDIGARLLTEQNDVHSDLQRIVSLWQSALATSGGPFLFGDYTIADAYYAPVVTRIRTYALPVPDDVAAYCQRIFDTSSMRAWVRDALLENDYVAEDEPYRSRRE